MKHTFTCSLIILFTSLSFSSLALAGNLDSSPAKEVILQLKWKHQFQFAGYYAAVAKGFYSEVGLKVHLKELAPDSNVVDTIIGGKADFGIMDSDLIRSRSQGIPVVALGVIYQHSPLALVASSISGITELHHLTGKRVSLETHSADIYAMLKTATLPKHLLEVTDHHFNPNDLLTGQVDAMSVYTSDEIFLLRQENFKYRLFSPRNYGIDFYGDTLFTSEKMITEQPDLVEKFRKASIKGWNYALSHSDEIVNYIQEQYGSRHSREHLLFEAQITMDLVLSNLVEVGYMHEDRWKHIYEIYKSVGMIKGPVDFDSFIYKPEPDNSKFYNVIIAISLILIVISIVAIVYFFINRKLKRQISESNSLRKQLKDHAADLKRSNDALENFTAIASHDLQEPLRKIITFSTRIKQNAALKERESNYLERMESATKRMQTFIQDLLEFSKINAKPREFKQVDLNKIVLEVLSDLETQIEQTGGTVDVETLPTILADRFQIRQLFLNLISNAIKFHKEDSLPKVKIKSQLTPDGFWKISIKDNGVGFDTKYTSKILKPFERLHGRTEYEGSGMGLAICDKIVERHGGLIDVESSPGNDTTFHISLPQEPNKDTPSLDQH
ncbi:MAG: ABC transporter substrate-binding protein [Nitrospinae bacterium]|nr:ABC transporter substrate-binding protein [Nitrospinota bacterium]MBL7019450.1 ABC transporter substrate-binding protein [Nitrospinaceae bacterium]